MPYLICDKCEVFYEIDSDFDFSDFNTCQKCGENLKYYESFDEFNNEKDLEGVHEGKSPNINSFDNKSLNYNKNKIIGFTLAIIGLFMFMLAYLLPSFVPQNLQNPDNTLNFFVQIILIYIISFILMAAGVLIYVYGKRKGNNHERSVKKEKRKKSVKTSIKKEKLTVDYFDNLPEGYFILNNLKISGKKIKIDHVVIGSKGIFLTMIKNSHGHYIINGNEWLNDKGNKNKNAIGNPSQHVKLNAIELKRFLESKNLNIDYILINSIVAFTDNNFKVRKMPKTYEVMNVREISNFILNSKRKMDMGTVTGAVLLLERYCSGVMRS